MSRFIQLVLGLCLLLLFVLLIEWFIAKASDNNLAQSLMPDKEKNTMQNQLAEWTKPQENVESYAEMVTRPLFIEGRRPVVEDEVEEGTQDNAKIEDLELQGIYSVKGQTHVLFRQQGKEQNFVKKVTGDEISGWVVQEIQNDRVIMEQSGQEQILMLRKPKPGTIAESSTHSNAKPKPKLKSRQQQRTLEEQLQAQHEQQMEEQRRLRESVETPNNPLIQQ